MGNTFGAENQHSAEIKPKLFFGVQMPPLRTISLFSGTNLPSYGYHPSNIHVGVFLIKNNLTYPSSNVQTVTDNNITPLLVNPNQAEVIKFYSQEIIKDQDKSLTAGRKN